MAKGNVGSLLVFDPAKIDFANDEKVKAAAGDAVVGIITERGVLSCKADALVTNQSHVDSLLFMAYRLLDKSGSEGQDL